MKKTDNPDITGMISKVNPELYKQVVDWASRANLAASIRKQRAEQAKKEETA
ncbi:hypothetical protein P4S95_10410 [Aneurinibacillus aneurinilyticus]|uniref:hypothetical protein n=1 Tax=Aneurinibacillus aneurinilyticus TaxID=1391 RepID=UPI002E2223D6|nr:hypothetical protein [Aneurinibacillus aneurinilyticus]